MLMFLPDPEEGVISVYAKFDNTAIPEFIAFNETVIWIDGYTENTIDVSLICGDSVVWSASNVNLGKSLQSSSACQTRSWYENNAIRNLCAISEVVTGIAGVGFGVALTVGSAGLEVGSGGLSTPVSVAGIAAGIWSITGACNTIKSGLTILFGPGDSYKNNSYVSNELKSIGMEKIGDALSDSYKNKFLKQILPREWMNRPNSSPSTFWFEFGLNTIDKLWGKTITEADRLAALGIVHRKIAVVTGKVEAITHQSATLWGYVSPEATRPDGIEKVQTEMGIVLYETNNEQSRCHKNIIAGNGGSFSFQFDDLKDSTEYSYFTYFYDRVHMIFRKGEVETFSTSMESIINISAAYQQIAAFRDNEYDKILFTLAYTPIFENIKEDDLIEWGVFLYDNIEVENGYEEGEQYPSPNKKMETTEFSFEFYKDELKYLRNAVITKGRWKICAYADIKEYIDYISEDGSHHRREICTRYYGDLQDLELRYEDGEQPEWTFENWHVFWETRTGFFYDYKYSITGYIEGAYWVKSVQFYDASTGSNKGWQTAENISSGKNTFSHSIHVWKRSSDGIWTGWDMDVVKVRILLKNGEVLWSGEHPFSMVPLHNRNTLDN